MNTWTVRHSYVDMPPVVNLLIFPWNVFWTRNYSAIWLLVSSLTLGWVMSVVQVICLSYKQLLCTCNLEVNWTFVLLIGELKYRKNKTPKESRKTTKLQNVAACSWTIMVHVSAIYRACPVPPPPLTPPPNKNSKN